MGFRTRKSRRLRMFLSEQSSRGSLGHGRRSPQRLLIIGKQEMGMERDTVEGGGQDAHPIDDLLKRAAPRAPPLLGERILRTIQRDGGVRLPFLKAMASRIATSRDRWLLISACW